MRITKTQRAALERVGQAERDRQDRIGTALGGVSAREQTGVLYNVRLSDSHPSRAKVTGRGAPGHYRADTSRGVVSITKRQAEALAEAGLVELGEVRHRSEVVHHYRDGWGWAIHTYVRPLTLTDEGRRLLGLPIPCDLKWEGRQPYPGPG